MPESAARIQEMAPTRAAAADQFYDDRVARIAKGDANDSLGDRVDRDLQPRVSRYSCSPEERGRSPMEALEGQEAWIFAPPTSHSCPKIVGTVRACGAPSYEADDKISA
jgi:hypothetical protein